MKKFIFCLVLALSLSSVSHAQEVDKLMKKASKAENVYKVKIGGLLMGVTKMCGSFDDIPQIKGLNGMEVYDLSDCDEKTKEEIKQEFDKVKDGRGYETLVYTKDSKDAVRIMIKKDKKNTIKEMVFFLMDENDPSIVKLSGKFKEDDIAQLINESSK